MVSLKKYIQFEGKMKILGQSKSNKSFIYLKATFRRSNRLAACLALGASAFLIGLTSPAPALAQSALSGVATVGFALDMESKQGGFAASVGLFSRINQVLSLGLNLGYDKYGTETTNLGINYKRHVLAADISLRIRKPSGNTRPYATIGGGILILSTEETWHYDDGSNFSSRRTSKMPMLILGVGLDFPKVLGALGAGIHARYRLAAESVSAELGLEHYLTISLGISLN